MELEATRMDATSTFILKVYCMSMITLTQHTTTLVLLVMACMLVVLVRQREQFIAPRVVGGIGVDKVPSWFVITSDGGCGACLISPDVVLTAGHCVRGRVTMEVRVGYSHPSSREVIKVRRIVIHPQYKEFGSGADGTAIYDVALLFLEKPVRNLAPIKRASKNPAPGEKVTIIGLGLVKAWDTEASNPEISGATKLQKASLTVVSNSDCKKAHDKVASTETVARYISQAVTSPSVLCTVSKKGISGCHGDSGGPVINGRGELVGAVSFGSKGCGYQAKGAVYTMAASIPYTNKWIDAEIAKVRYV